MKRSKESVNYREGTGARCCGKCVMYEPPHDCSDVKGEIYPDDVCDIYAARPASVYIIRHGSTEHNRGGVGKDKIRGHLNIPMSMKGVREVQQTADELAYMPLDAIYTSDLVRASRTAVIIANKQAVKPKIVESKDLRSWDLGTDLEGQVTTPSVVRKIVSLVRNDTKTPAGGESFKVYADRVLAYVDPIFKRTAKTGETVAIVSHGRVCQIIDLWITAGCDEECLHRDYADELVDEPDDVPPGGAVLYVHEKGGWKAKQSEHIRASSGAQQSAIAS